MEVPTGVRGVAEMVNNGLLYTAKAEVDKACILLHASEGMDKTGVSACCYLLQRITRRLGPVCVFAL